MNWPPVSTLYLLTCCSDSEVKAFRNILKRKSKIPNSGGFITPVSGWCSNMSVMHSSGHQGERVVPSLRVTWTSLSCFPAYKPVSLGNHLMRTVSPSVLLSFAFFLPFGPTVPARVPEPRLFIWLNYIKVPIPLTSRCPRHNLSELSSLHSQLSCTKFKWVTVNLIPDRLFAFFLKTFMVAPFEI